MPFGIGCPLSHELSGATIPPSVLVRADKVIE
jgi:hypothetical protein